MDEKAGDAMYCTVEEVLGMIKDDMRSAIVGDEYIEDKTEIQERMEKLCERAISDACAEIDGYLAKRYAVPFRKAPPTLNKFAKDIAAYNLVSRTGIDEAAREKTFLNRYNAAIKFLFEVAKGTIRIGCEEQDNRKAAENGFQISASKRLFSRESMKGW